MNNLSIFVLILIQLCYGLQAKDISQRSGFPTECCVCDDSSSIKTKRCSHPGVCDQNFRVCQEYCHTERHFRHGKWKIVRGCADQTTCVNYWYQTLTTLGCIDNRLGDPPDGTTCYSCCRTPSPLTPHYCQEDPDTHFIRFNVTTIPTTTSTTTTSTPTPTTTYTTRPTTTTTPTTSTASTTTSTTTKSTTTVLTKLSTSIAPTTTVKSTPVFSTQIPGTECEVCKTSNCTNPQTVTCSHGEDFCMNTIITNDNGDISLKKECSTDTQCYYDAYVYMKNSTDCKQATQTGTFSKKGICHYCCKNGPGNQPCNKGVIPQEIFDYDNPNATHCMVGQDGSYTRQRCDKVTPACMNTIIRSSGLKIVQKSCEDEIVCNTDWWKNSRNHPECMTSDIASLNQTLQNTGVVCHYCCTSKDDKTCNDDEIPTEALNKFPVDGKWASWQAWNGCSPTCQGTRIRIRTCSNPYPKNGGSQCAGSAFQQEMCPSNCHGTGGTGVAIVG